jgi:Fe-S-cluster-containing dehydrogenase component
VRRARPKLDRALLEGQGRGTAARRTLHALLRGARGPLPLEQALSFALDIAEDLADDEARGPSQAAPLTPDDVIVVDDRAAFAPEFAPTKAELAPVWCPPPQVDGAPFDHQANRYVLGLLLYKMLTGSHPFGGMGLREMLEAARSSEPPPFKQEQATALPPGLQSLVLKLLSQDPAARPSSAAEVADALHGFSGRAGLADAGPRGGGPPAALFAHDTLPSSGVARDAVLREAAERRAAAPAARLEAPPGLVAAPPPKRPAPSAKGWVAALLPLALGAAVAAAAVTQLKPPDATPQPKASVGAMKAIGPGELTAEDCASCHARQASEWRRSVMGHAVKSPLFNALEALVQEQIGRDNDCPNGAGALRKTTAELACRNPQTGVAISGSGGEHWCVNCHAPSEVQENLMPPWDGRGRGNPRANFPVKDLIGERAKEGISCGFCHQVHGPVSPRSRSAYQGNPTWTSFVTGAVFESRPEDRAGLFGISNSGYEMRLGSFVLGGKPLEEGPDGSALVHARPDDAQRKYLRSSEFCGACHDVRLFGSDAINAPAKGEHFKRLRNAYSEWRDWARLEERKGKTAATCIDCHMSEYPGACEPDPGGAGDDLCPEGTRWVKRAPGTFPKGRVASSSQELTPITTHYLSGVDLPLSHDYPKELLDESSLDLAGIPISAKKRRDALLKAAFDFDLGTLSLKGDRLLVPVEIENIGGGHKIPAGFSQEREIWVHLTVKDGQGRTLYEVGRVDRPDEDLRDKIFDRVNTDPHARRPPRSTARLVRRRRPRWPRSPRVVPSPGDGRVALRGQGPDQLPERLPALRDLHRDDRVRRLVPAPARARAPPRGALRRRRVRPRHRRVHLQPLRLAGAVRDVLPGRRPRRVARRAEGARRDHRHALAAPERAPVVHVRPRGRAGEGADHRPRAPALPRLPPVLAPGLRRVRGRDEPARAPPERPAARSPDARAPRDHGDREGRALGRFPMTAAGPSPVGVKSFLDAPILRGLDARAQRELEAATPLVDAQPGKALYQQGERADSFYVVLGGSVELAAARREGAPAALVRTASAGESFGEEATVTGRRHASALAGASGARVAKIPVHMFPARRGALGARRARRSARAHPAARGRARRDRGLTARAEPRRGRPRVDRRRRLVPHVRAGPGDLSPRRRLGRAVRGRRRASCRCRARTTSGCACGPTSGEAISSATRSSRTRPRAPRARSRTARRSCSACPPAWCARSPPKIPSCSPRLRRVSLGTSDRQREIVGRAAKNATQHVFRDLYRVQVARSLLVIDLETCVRCGQCSWACGSLYGASRLIRRGDKIVGAGLRADGDAAPDPDAVSSLLLPSSCQHCENPACMVDCPTGAIGKDEGGEVFIREELCTGCGACARACPWTNIQMSPRPKEALRPAGIPAELLATKCDLCRTYERGPACVQVCPTGSILRVDPQRDWSEVAALLGGARRAARATAARPVVPAWSVVGGAAIGAAAIALVGLVMRSRGHWVPWRGVGYGAGWAAGGAMLALASYALPKRLVRVWMRLGGRRSSEGSREDKTVRSVTRPHYLAHLALGLFALGLALVHAPHLSLVAPTLGSALLLCLALASATGIAMGLVYAGAPAALSRIERSPLLPEDFAKERLALSTRLYKHLSGRDDLLKAVAERVLLPYAQSLLGPIALVASGRTLAAEERRLRGRIDDALAGRGASRLGGLDDLVRTAVELRALPAQRALTLALRSLLPVHIVAFALALVLLIAHVVQALGAAR